MGRVIQFQPAFNKRSERIAEQLIQQQLEKTFPFILVESYILVERDIDWSYLSARYNWDQQLIERLQNYAACLIMKGGSYINIYNDISSID